MSVAGFVLGLIGTVLAVASLGWQTVAYRLGRPRPILTPVIGRLTPDGLVTNDASSELRESLVHAAEQLEHLDDMPIIIGVKVVNNGRAPFHVAGWAIRSDPAGVSLAPIEKPIAGADVPHDIPPGGGAVFLTELQHAHRFANALQHVNGADVVAVGQPRIVLTVSSGTRTYSTKPIAPELFSIE